MTRISTLLLWATLASCSCGEDVDAPADPETAPTTEEPDPRRPGPQTRLGNVRGLKVRSRLVPLDDPDSPLTLEFSLAFPARARHQLLPEGGRPFRRRIRYEFGDYAWGWEPDSASVELEGEARLELRRDVALRRALFLWPDGFEWTFADERAEADLGPLGRLHAQWPKEDAPLETLRLAAPDGVEHSGFVDVCWREQDGRSWPSAMVHTVSSVRTWEEEVLSVDPRQHFLDEWFTPADRRRGTDEPQPIKTFELRPAVLRRIPLDAGRTLEEALARHAQERARELEGGRSVDPSPTIEIDEGTRPVAILLRLEGSPETPPEGWILRGARPGLSRYLPDLGGLRPGDLSDLRRAVPRGTTPGTPFVRVKPAPDGARRAAEVVLPLAPE